jgi:UDP-N-acetylmuramyl pentapeptide phosphotransferase/UDP-N-acetylglucosamine-1-phosphate transferase
MLMNALALFAGAALLSAALAWGWRSMALARHWLDLPDARRLHTAPTPRGGGVAIAAVMLACSPWLGAAAPAFAAGLVITAAGGLLDDLRPLRALPKLAIQGLGALPLAVAVPLMPEQLGQLMGVVLAWSSLLVLVNFWNFMDGSNGMAAGQALIVGLGLAWLAGAGSAAGLLGLAMAAGCLGFLPFNLPRARLFLGDVGSFSLGYGVAAALLIALSEGQAQPWHLLLLPSAFLLDAGLTLALRVARRQRFWLAHREHVYQRAVAHGFSHGAVMLAYAGWGVLAAWLGVVFTGSGDGLLIALLLLSLAGLIVYVSAILLWPLPSAVTMSELSE